MNLINEGDTVVIRSHGVSPEIYDILSEKKAVVIDATCPFVKRIHDIVSKADKEDKTVIIIGRADHPEVVGIKGRSNSCHIVSSIDEINSIGKIAGEIVVVSQTTMNTSLFSSLCEHIKQIYPDAQVFNTICETTRRRQDEAVDLAKTSDVVLVVGGKNSANTAKLFDLCSQYCKNTYYVENKDEVSLENLHQTDIISIIAGASTPDWIIWEVFLLMSENEKVLDAQVETEETGISVR